MFISLPGTRDCWQVHCHCTKGVLLTWIFFFLVLQNKTQRLNGTVSLWRVACLGALSSPSLCYVTRNPKTINRCGWYSPHAPLTVFLSPLPSTFFFCFYSRFYSETLNNEYIECRILHFLIMECCRYLVFFVVI